MSCMESMVTKGVSVVETLEDGEFEEGCSCPSE